MTAIAELRGILKAHHPADAEEGALCSRMLSVIEGAERPLDSLSFEPGHFTASALVLSPRQDCILLIHHPVFRRWIQPGGHVESTDTTLYDASLRELREETGLCEVRPHGRIDLDLHAVPAHPGKGHPAHLHFDIRFWLVADRMEFQPVEGGHPHRWIPLEQIDGVATDASVLKAIRRLQQ